MVITKLQPAAPPLPYQQCYIWYAKARILHPGAHLNSGLTGPEGPSPPSVFSHSTSRRGRKDLARWQFCGGKRREEEGEGKGE
jgi:hypothetical protein